MNKYHLGRDILVSWSLDLGGQLVNLAGCDFVFEYSAAGGSVRVPSADYTIENNTLSWTFKKEDQHAYGLYSLRLLAFDDGAQLAEFKNKAAFEIIHGTPTEQEQTLAMQSSVETAQDGEEEPSVEPSDDVDHYVSRSPLHVEKVPLGSNLIVRWKLLSAADFDFDLTECELALHYAAAGSGYQTATDFELKTTDGYFIEWNFAAANQVRFGLYSLFLDIYQDGVRIATLIKEDAFALVHRRGSELLADRIISFESVVTTLGGGALYALADVLNNGYSTVFRADGVTPAASGDVLLFNGEKWLASNDADLASFSAMRDALTALASRMNLMDETVAGIVTSLDAALLDIASNTAAINANSLAITGLRSLIAALTDRMTAAEGDISALGDVVSGQGSDIDDIIADLAAAIADIRQNTAWIKADEDSIAQLILDASSITASVEDIYGNIAELQITSTAIATRVSDAEGNISTLQQTAEGFDLRVANVEGDVGELYLTAIAFGTRISNAEGDISTLEQTATSLTSRITNAEGDVAVLQQTATSLTSRISSAEGDISTLEQTATSLTSSIQSAQGDISILQQTATGLQYQVSNQAGDIATLQVSARSLTSRISNAEGDISVLEQTASSLTSRISNAEGDISVLEQTATSLTSRITNAEGDISTLTQTAASIELAVQAVDTEVSRYERVTDAALANMQDQIDGVIETWYYNGVPTLNNLPASQWTTAEEKANHVGDLYYDKDTGKAYRFMLDNTQTPAVYVWVGLADEDIAKALALAGVKRRVFVVTPYAPYDAGDLWIRAKTIGSSTSTNEIWRCKTSRAADASPAFLESEWEPADNFGYIVNKSNLEVLSDAIVGQVGAYTYNADGTLTTSSVSTIQQTASSIRLATVVDNVALAGITIDSTNHTGSITIFSDNFFIKDGSHTKTALAVTHDAQGNSLIDVASLNVAGIFTTSAWLGVQGVGGERNSILSDAETNAETYANSSAYLTGYVVPLINSATAGLAVDSDYSYLKTALENQTTALGGLMLTSLIQLGATQSGSSWSVHSGISGEYIETSDPTDPEYHVGHGIAAWFGGPMVDLAEHLTDDPVPAHAKTVFRMDGSGYLADRAIYWGDQGDLHLNTNIVLGDTTPGNPTINSILTFMARFGSWFVEDTTTMTGKTLLRINMGSQQGTGFDGLIFDGFLISGGDQIVGSGTPGGGGGGGGAEWLYELSDVYGTTAVLRANGTEKQVGDVLQYYDSTKGWVAVPSTSIGITTDATQSVHGLMSAADKTKLDYVGFGTAGSDYVPVYLGGSTPTNVLTAHQSLSGYVAKNGSSSMQIITSQDQVPLGLDSTYYNSSEGYVTGLILRCNNTNSAQFGHSTINGTYLFNYATGKYLYLANDGNLKYGYSGADFVITSANWTSYVGASSSYPVGYATNATYATYDSAGHQISAYYLPYSYNNAYYGAIDLNDFGTTDSIKQIAWGFAEYADVAHRPGTSADAASVLSFPNYYGGLQLYTYYESNNTYYIRNWYTNQSWSNWVLLYHSGNLSLSTLAGSSTIGGTTQPIYYNGSSLVAGTSLGSMAYESAASYLPLSGGKMTGAINFNDYCSIYTGDYVLKVNNAYGQAWFGPMNATYCHIYTDRDSFYFNKAYLYANGGLVYHSNNCNNTSTPWSASSLTLAGAISGATTIYATSTITADGAIRCMNDLDIMNPANTLGTFTRLGFNVSGRGYVGYIDAYWDNSDWSSSNVANGHMNFVLSTTTGLTTIMAFSNAGNVGIGTSNPVAKFNVEGSYIFHNDAYITDITNGFRLVDAGWRTSFVFYNNWSSGSGIYVDDRYTLYIQETGGTTQFGGQIISAGDQVISSDITKKTNFQNIQLSVEQIANAPAVTFDWKAGGHSFGSIAQYWKPLLGEMVLGEEGNYSLAYAQGAFVNAIINARAIVALQDHETEQDKEIRELKEALGKANEKIIGLENEIKQLRS